jgi:hypothetical protein
MEDTRRSFRVSMKATWPAGETRISDGILSRSQGPDSRYFRGIQDNLRNPNLPWNGVPTSSEESSLISGKFLVETNQAGSAQKMKILGLTPIRGRSRSIMAELVKQLYISDQEQVRKDEHRGWHSRKTVSISFLYNPTTDRSYEWQEETKRNQ